MQFEDLPALNATLNGLSGILLLTGFAFIRNGYKNAHRNCMVGAIVASALFLISYLVYHFEAGGTVFREPAWFRPIYLFILVTHIILAVAIVPMVIVTVVRAAKERFEKHKRLARWTFPVWLYVSVTGVLIYLLLYQIFPQNGMR